VPNFLQVYYQGKTGSVNYLNISLHSINVFRQLKKYTKPSNTPLVYTKTG